MLNAKNSNKNKNDDNIIVHDINASISALQGAFEVIGDEWRKNPELVDRLLPLTLDKINQLQLQLINFRRHSS